MKGTSFMGGVLLGVLLVVFAGISQAGMVPNKSIADGKAARGAVTQAISFAESGEGGPSLEYWGALETGSVSKGEERSAKNAVAREFSFSDSGENGPALEYWEAIETGSIPVSKAGDRLLDTGVDPSRWEGPTQ